MTLDGLNYKSDTRKVHQLIHGFVHGETAETWVNPKERKQDVRLDYLALLAHYGGKVNKAVWVKYSEVLQKLIIYKINHSLSVQSSPKLFDQGLLVARLRHRVATQLRIQTVVR